MSSRLELHAIFKDILGSDYVYFQPPASVKMSYPAIRYSRKNIENLKADDAVYRQKICYEVIVIDKNPDNEYVEKLSCLPYSRFDRHYAADNLNHDVFTIYY